MKTGKRLYYLDYLKLVLTVLVIAHHASQAYAPKAIAWPVMNPTRSVVLFPITTVNAAFFMGLFFLIAGYFVPGAYDRKGAGAYLKPRFIRLGIPALFFATFVFGPIQYYLIGGQISLTTFIRHLYQGGWQALYIHLWFLLHLLLYTSVYVLWRLITGRLKMGAISNRKIHWHLALLVFSIILVLIAWVVRFKYTINEWVPLLYMIPAEMFHLPQYISMFLLGMLAYRFSALDRLPTAVGLVWFGLGLIAAGWFYYDNLLGERFMMSQSISGKNMGSLIWSTWEALVCVGLGVGLLVLFREWIRKRPGSWISATIRAQYGTYIFHLLIIIALQAALAGNPLPPFTKFSIVTISGVVLSFGFSHLILKTPGLKKII